MHKNSRIFVAGHRGLIGSAIVNDLRRKGYNNLILRTHAELDLEKQPEVEQFFRTEKPDVVFLCAAKVGGIHANNTLRAEFIARNLGIQQNVIWSAHENNVENFIFLGSSCIYPRDCDQPMTEDALLSGPLEFTNRPYAIAKIAGMELINAINMQYGRKYFSVMPTNMYGPGDQFDLNHAHVLPSLLRKFVEAKKNKTPSVEIWGTGKPKREFLFSQDCADAIVYLAENVDHKFFDQIAKSAYQFYHINVGSGMEVSIAELAQLIRKIVGYQGELTWNTTKPDGTPRKLLDCRRLFSLGWQPKTSLEAGLTQTLEWYLNNQPISD